MEHTEDKKIVKVSFLEVVISLDLGKEYTDDEIAFLALEHLKACGKKHINIERV